MNVTRGRDRRAAAPGIRAVTTNVGRQHRPTATTRAAIRYREYRPSPPLRPYIECFWIAQSNAPHSTRPREILLPDGTTQLFLSAAGGYERFESAHGGHGVRIAGSHLVGMRTHGVFIEQHGIEDIFAVRFRAGGLSPFLGMPVAGTVHQSIPLEALLGPAADELEGRVIEARTADERIDIVERMLLRRLGARNAIAPDQSRIGRAVERIYRAHGRIAIDQLGGELGMSYRALDRAFSRHVGIPPKRLSRIVRFNYALSLMQRSADACHCRIALEAGYADQAHMIRDFKQFTQSAPTDFLARRYGIVEVSQPAMRNRLSNSFNPER